MKTINKKTTVYLSGLLVLLASLTLPSTLVNASTANTNKSTIISESEINALLSIYAVDEEIPINNTIVKIYDKNDNLVFSDNVCQNLAECDERLNHLINQSDFLTEVDNTKIYILNQ